MLKKRPSLPWPCWKTGNLAIQSDLDAIKSSSQKALEAAQRTLPAFEDMAGQQGTAEMSIFFQNGSSNLEGSALANSRPLPLTESSGRYDVRFFSPKGSSTGIDRAASP
jgi:hypothetical protein